ncbi:hypothetical protein H072_10072 [Dactylellina haptotyla CBS 200.50]|uniref:Uncharacterized protein n=1 Tax=Dactylellina haptotyla (strain CBS 200.50) TaxID=1284197 RepID=S8BB95_DACHA|nr:hypothetical protein H072_10072 [Dactylellina haptotyla CBS 200.50]
MGGSAFKTQDLFLPRLKPQTYHRLKAHHHSTLAKLYAHVTTPPEAPGKPSYGDIDFLVAEPLPHVVQNSRRAAAASGRSAGVSGKLMDKATVDLIKAALGAEYARPPETTTSYAVPLGEGDTYTSEAEDVGTDDNVSAESRKAYAQIDVHVCPSVENMHWVAFKHSYGDMWSLLGMIGRTRGLVADEERLCVKVAEIEPRNKELSKIELTRDVGETLRFFGLDCGVYENGFENLNAVYGYVTTSRFYSEMYFRRKAYMNSRDKKKLRKRDMMSGFFEYLGFTVEPEDGEQVWETEDIEGSEGPKSMSRRVSTSSLGDEEKERERELERMKREEVLQEALEKFGKRNVYDEKVRLWRRDCRIEEIQKGVAEGLVAGEHCSINSARRRAKKIRKEIQSGELEDANVFDMTESEVKVFIEKRVKENVKDILSRGGNQSDSEKGKK